MTTAELASDAVTRFKDEFYKQFKVFPEVTYKIPQEYKPPLELIKESCERVLNKLSTQVYLEGLKTKTSDQAFLLYRYSYFKIANEWQHNASRSARFLGLKATNARYGNKKLDLLLMQGDSRSVRVYEACKEELNKLIVTT